MQALQDNNIDFDESRIFFITNYYFEEGQVVYKNMETLFPDTDAIFCAAGDIVATGIMLEIKKAGKEIPKDISIIGYDDFIASSMTNPSLTTVHQPLTQIGKDSYATVLKLLNKDETVPREMSYSPFLVRREST